MVGRSKSRVGGLAIAEFPVIALIAGRGLMNLVRAMCGRKINHDREFIEIGGNGFGPVSRRLQRLCNNHRVGLSNVVNDGNRNRRMRWLDHVGTVLGLDHPSAGQVPDLISGQIGARIRRHDTLHR